MTLSKLSLSTALCGAIFLSACTDPNDPNRQTKTGALVGAGAGAVVGALMGNDPEERRRNAVLGAAIGGGGGAIIGNQLDKQEADLRAQLGNDNVTIRNTGDRLIVTLPQDILFATDSASLRPDLQRELRLVGQNLLAYPDTTVQVLGHTDNTGDAGYNLDLSQRRAQSVANILMSEGVPSFRIQSIGRGEDQPIASNLTPDGRAQNRRVEIVVLPNA
ncbi:OmpA family protein [Marivita sp. S6314]|uniref:OmpA family protein n=1 Tax=Marivita sp. S6314 TaxID=2926406 RepID=UPI001FF2121E|nr:OmpA family protein [Marivita sp. S6314]MCK0151750.1 OmpA family protein [Marivita sp. S6314]